MKSVIKRDGRIVPFDEQKIIDAILAAFIEVDHEVSDYALAKAESIAAYIDGYCEDCPETTIEQIQDLVENGLMATKRKDVAKAYIKYRDKRERDRTRNTLIMKKISEKLHAKAVVNQNANVDERSFGGRRGEAANELMKQIALDECMSEKSRYFHLNNLIYIHDLDTYAVGEHNCLSIPFDKLLANGFNTRQTDVRPANSVNTAFQLVAVIFQLQSLQQFGGVSATHLDWTMVPYVQKSFIKHMKDGLTYIEKKSPYKVERFEKWFKANDLDIEVTEEFKEHHADAYQYALDMTVKETYQAVEGMYHNLNY